MNQMGRRAKDVWCTQPKEGIGNTNIACTTRRATVVHAKMNQNCPLASYITLLIALLSLENPHCLHSYLIYPNLGRRAFNNHKLGRHPFCRLAHNSPALGRGIFEAAINLPAKQKGYGTFETTTGKLSARRTQICFDYFRSGIILKVILNNFQSNA